MDQIGRLEAIVYVPAKGEPSVSVTERNVSEAYGLEGDYHGAKGDSSLMVWTKEARDKLNAQNFSGICFQRFRENLSLSGLDLSKVKAKDRLVIGEVVLEVEPRKKACHPDICPLTEGRADCLLKKQSLYVKVIKPGLLLKGASVCIER
ncbi:MAG: hypothetical protein HFI12_09785 [Lachnospiraceae bacterium]|jgi:MOSC domain-containing protein YiiM|nr:hypothetical protein [Lachnospiraceae bacterium]